MKRVTRRRIISSILALAQERKEEFLEKKTGEVQERKSSDYTSDGAEAPLETEDMLFSIGYRTQKIEEYKLFCQQIIKPSKGNGCAGIGSILKVREKKEVTFYFIVESNPFEKVDLKLADGLTCELITPDVPVAKALIKRKPGEKVEVQTPKPPSRSIKVLSVM